MKNSYALKKGLGFWAVFIVLYGSYRFFPVFPLSLICGTVESTFQHLKAGFYSYLIVNLIEYGRNHRRISARESYLYARMTATILLPWMIFLLWYVAPALIGRWPNNVYEIVYANLITLLAGSCAVVLEGGFEKGMYLRAQKTVLIMLFLTSILLYTVFTFAQPWADVFVEPIWR